MNKSEQRGVFILLLFIFILLTVNLALPYFIFRSKYDYSTFQSEINNFLAAKQKMKDSLRIEKLQNSGDIDYEMAKKKLKPFPFNPNKLPEKSWLKLGLTAKQVHSIKKYEAKGGKFRRKEDLKKLYALSEIEYEILAPYVRIRSEFVSEMEKPQMREKNKKSRQHIFKRYVITDINHSDSAMIVRNLDLSPWLARRIINYRKLLGGYYSKNQLKEVYGLKNFQFQKIEKYLIVDTAAIHKIDINNAGFKEIIHHPYIDYQATKNIMSGRKKRKGYRNLKEIGEDLSLRDSVMNKLKHYLYLRPFKNYKDE